MKIKAGLVLLCLVLGAPALGAGKKTHAVNRKTQSVDFEGDTVDGKGRNPDGAYLLQKRSVDFVPLYKVRDRFDDNIRASIEYIK